jgi:hypothetical protein
LFCYSWFKYLSWVINCCVIFFTLIQLQIKCCFYTQNGCMNKKKILQRLIPSQIPDRFSKLLCSTIFIFRISRCPFPYLWRHSSMRSKYVSRHISCMGVSHEGKYCTKFLNQYSFETVSQTRCFVMWYINVIFIKFIKFTTFETVLI